MIDNLKQLVSLMKVKQDFVVHVSFHYGSSFPATLKNWFGGDWNIPEKKLPEVIAMAQKFLFNQTEKERKALLDTGYEFEEIKSK